MSDYLERLMGKAQGDFWASLPESQTPAGPTETRSVRRDTFDISAWDQIIDQVPALGELVEESREEHPTSPAMYEDIFNLLNQGDPRFQDLDRMQATYLPQYAMEQAMFDSQDFQWVRNETKYDEYNTALAMLSMKDQVEDALDQVQDAMDAIDQAAQELAEAMAAAQAFIDAGGVPEPGEPGEGGIPVQIIGPSMTPEDEAALIERLENAMKGMAEAEAEGDKAGEEAGKKMEAAASDARDTIEQDKQNASAYGIEDGVLQRMDFEQRRRLAERLNRDRLSRFANILGQFTTVQDAEVRRKVTRAPADKFDVELGNDLHAMLGSEFVNMAIPELEDLFWLRFAQKALPQWVTRGTDKRGKGPIIFIGDESGSMGATLDKDGNTREAWMKALALALCDQARRSKRDFIYIGFSSSNQQWETHFEGGVRDYEKVIEFAEHMFNGGTHYERPLTRAMELIGQYERQGKPKPDIVFATDDECHVQPAFVAKWSEVKERADVRCYGIAIGARGHSTAMAQVVDRTIEISQLNADASVATELFRTI